MNKLKLKSALETPAPIPCRVLSMEIESYHRKIAEIENKNFAREDLAIYRAEILLRIDLYRLSSGEAYERIADVAKGDKSAAIKLFHDLNGHGWKDKFGWIGQSKTTVRPEIPMFEAEGGLFDGIQSSERRISGITLTNNGCEGQLSDRIGDFAALNTLYLDCNNIEGKIPRGLGRLELLEYFNLSGNQLVGELDQRSLTKLTTLRILNLSFNGLSGELPDCFDSITKLQELNLSGNKFHGPLPNSMSTCVNIRHLQLYSNQFSGRVPDWLSNLTNLVSINLSQNQ
jgi:Leucine-rich repeat (LRR) protein